jgi:hypothetical protein
MRIRRSQSLSSAIGYLFRYYGVGPTGNLRAEGAVFFRWPEKSFKSTATSKSPRCSCTSRSRALINHCHDDVMFFVPFSSPKSALWDYRDRAELMKVLIKRKGPMDTEPLHHDAAGAVGKAPRFVRELEEHVSCIQNI